MSTNATSPQDAPAPGLARLVNAFGELATNHPTDNGPTSTLHLTEASGPRHRVPLDPGHVEWLARLIEDLLHDLSTDLADDQCPRCSQIIEEENPFAPDPALLY